MRNPFKNPFKQSSCKQRGLPDNFHHARSPPHDVQQNDTPTVISVSGPPPSPAPTPTPTSVPQPIYPAGYPNTNNNYYGQNNHPQMVQPATAYPYQYQQDTESAGAEWELNAGGNRNMKGQQKGGDIRVANNVPGSALPQSGKFVFNTGNNYNEGERQENGKIEFGNNFSSGMNERPAS